MNKDIKKLLIAKPLKPFLKLEIKYNRYNEFE